MAPPHLRLATQPRLRSVDSGSNRCQSSSPDACASTTSPSQIFAWTPPEARGQAGRHVLLDDLAAAVDTSSQEFRDALAACAVILTSAGALDLRGDPELRAAILEDLAAFAACARAEGLVDFPDPDLSFDGTGPAFATDALPLGASNYQQVVEACQAQLAGTVP